MSHPTAPTTPPGHPADVVRGARTAVFVTFALTGLGLSSWLSRLPETRAALGLTSSQLGLLLLLTAAGSVVALPLSGALVARIGTARAVTAGVVLMSSGIAGAAAAAHGLGSPAATGAAMLVMGTGLGLWDVSMNLEGAEVERELRRSTMPAFHASFSFGTVAGAAGGAAAAALEVPVLVHLLLVAAVVLVAGLASVRRFLPRPPAAAATATAAAAPGAAAPAAAGSPSALAAWREPRTLLIGVMVLAAAFTEGTANDWLAIALVDGYGVEPAVGALGFAVFVSAMTAARLLGTRALDRWGRVPVLRVAQLLALVGVVVVVFGGSLWLAALGALLWGAGASLGFPVGISAAADDPAHAAVRVSVVTTIGYTAFIAGPPLLGFLGDHVGVLSALLVVAVLAVPSLLVSGVAAPVAGGSATGPGGGGEAAAAGGADLRVSEDGPTLDVRR